MQTTQTYPEADTFSIFICFFFCEKIVALTLPIENKKYWMKFDASNFTMNKKLIIFKCHLKKMNIVFGIN
jgi:hypothetical protein